MRLSLLDEIKAFRLSFLEREEELYKTITNGEFSKVKDWDDKNSTVIWEGLIEDPSLLKSYKVQINYGSSYPYYRPQIYSVEPLIINQRHQMPNLVNPKKPGPLCYMPVSPDYWHAGLTCIDLINRIVKWLSLFEAGTLDDEFAPPEIEIYFPSGHRVQDTEVLAIDTLILPEGKNEGSFVMIPTLSGKFSLIATLSDSQSTEEKAEELQRLRSLILPNDALANDWSRGRWFRLKSEPMFPVPLNSTALAKILLQNGLMQRDIYTLALENPSAIALCYPTEIDQLHWLLFKTKFTYPNRTGFRKDKYHLKFNETNKANIVKLYSLSQINVENIFRRVHGFPVEQLLQKKCLLLGAGTLGSTIAEELIKSGVGNLTIVDYDSLEIGNVCRHRLGLNYVGQNKARALKTELLQKNPFAKINVFTSNPLLKPEEFLSNIEAADLIISCFGNDSIELFVNAVCRRANKPAIYCRGYLEGRFGEIVIVQKGKKIPCLSCSANYLASDVCSIPRPPEKPYQELVRFDGDCGAAFIPASSVDLGLISLHCTRLALNHLDDPEAEVNNYFILRGRPFGPNEYTELIGEIREPFRIHSYAIPYDECCQMG